jgi:hypothetical protein
MDLRAWWRRRRAPPPAAPVAEVQGHTDTEVARLERLAEQAYAAMYDVPPLSSTKDNYDDARLYFQRSIEEARRLGLESEAARLTRRLEQICGVYDSQFRGF